MPQTNFLSPTSVERAEMPHSSLMKMSEYIEKQNSFGARLGIVVLLPPASKTMVSVPVLMI